MERRKLTAEEIRTLSRFDVDCRSAFPAARSNFLRSVGREGINTLKGIYKAVTGEDFRETADSCSSCELRLQRIIVAWYDADKAERAKEKEQTSAASGQKTAAEASAPLKTKGQRTRKK